MARYSKSPWTLAIDDRSGLRVKRNRMVWDNDTDSRNVLTTPEWSDDLNLDIVLARRKFNDAEAVRDPRPDINLAVPFAYPTADSTTWTADCNYITGDEIYFNPLTP